MRAQCAHNAHRPQDLPAPQWLCCDIRKFNLSLLGKFDVIMADPPWWVLLLGLGGWLVGWLVAVVGGCLGVGWLVSGCGWFGKVGSTYICAHTHAPGSNKSPAAYTLSNQDSTPQPHPSTPTLNPNHNPTPMHQGSSTCAPPRWAMDCSTMTRCCR